MASSLVHRVSILFLLMSITKVHSLAHRVFDVRSYGAVADGKTDNLKAILDAWNHTCQSIGGGAVLIPKGSYFVSSLVLTGPCKGEMVFTLRGDLKAPIYDESWGDTDHWISFQHIDNLRINGGGSFDGQGASAWPYNDCYKNPNCKRLPISLRLDFVTNARINNVKLINSKNFHVNIFSCRDVILDHVNITAPKDSPNTDGIHFGDSTNIKVWHSAIATGDDCLSFGPGMKDVEVLGVLCGPGHGISIGSLGKYFNEKDVEGIQVRESGFYGTQNGVRIKTWALPHASTVKNITFQGINMQNVANPIIIDQEYCPSNNCSPQGSSQVQIKDVKFENIWGTSSTKVAVSLNCSKGKPCQGINLTDINLVHEGKDGAAISKCLNVKGAAHGKQLPPSCL